MTALVLAALLAAGRDVLTVGILSDPVSLDPHRATDIVSAGILANVCEPLVRYRPDGSRPEPALAHTWASADRRRWTFTLRTGVHFHDGAPLDADAVVANLRNIARERSLPMSAERVGPAVVGVDLPKPNAGFLATLSQPFLCLVSPRELAHAPPRDPVGTGAFRLAQTARDTWELERNAAYWAGVPRLRRIVFRRYPDESALAAGLRAGTIDVAGGIGETAARQLGADTNIAVDTQTGLNIAFLSLNNERPPFSDRRVRQAIARAIDRHRLVSEVLDGHGEPARNPIPPSLWGYTNRTKELLVDRPFARRMLREAGLPEGFEARLLVVDVSRPYNPTPLRVAERIVEDLAAVGIRLRVVASRSWTEYLDRAGRGDYDMAVLGWQADTPDPNDFLSALVSSAALATTNRSGYQSAAMDALLEQGRRSADPRQRAVTYHEIQALFQKDMPWVPLYHVAAFTAYRRSVKGLTPGPNGLIRLERAWKSE